MNAPLHREIPAGILDAAQALSQVTAQWDGNIVRQLSDYIAIPAKSPAFDPDWAQHGHIDTVVRNAAAWVKAQKVEGLTLEVVRLEGRTPVLFFEIPASSGGASTSPLHQQGPQDRLRRTAGAVIPLGGSAPHEVRSVGATVLFYGHLDKQPEFTGWRNDLSPWTATYEDGKLYGRGGADDGYAAYASIAAVQALKSQNIAHPRIVGLIETCE